MGRLRRGVSSARALQLRIGIGYDSIVKERKPNLLRYGRRAALSSVDESGRFSTRENHALPPHSRMNSGKPESGPPLAASPDGNALCLFVPVIPREKAIIPHSRKS